MTATSTAADLITAALKQLRNAAGEVLSPILRPDGSAGLDPRATAGRIVVAPGQTIGSAWGNTVFDQSIMVFANAADRDNQYPAPHDGSVCYLTDVKRKMMYVGTAWQDDGGLIAYLKSTADTGTVNPLTDVAGLSATFTLASARVLEVSIGGLLNNGAATFAAMLINLSAAGLPPGETLYARNEPHRAGGGGQVTAYMSRGILFPAGTYTVKVQISIIAGGGANTATAIAGNTFLTIRDGGRSS
jgi:hypothetical protein